MSCGTSSVVAVLGRLRQCLVIGLCSRDKADAALNASVQHTRFVVVLLARVHVLEHQVAARIHDRAHGNVAHKHHTMSTLLAHGIAQ